MSYATIMPTHPHHHQYVNMTVCCWQFWNRAVIQERQLCRAALPQWATFLAVTHWESTCSSLWLSHSMGMRQKPLPPTPSIKLRCPSTVRRACRIDANVAKGRLLGRHLRCPDSASQPSLTLCVYGSPAAMLRYRSRQDCAGAGDSAFSKSSQVMPRLLVLGPHLE